MSKRDLLKRVIKGGEARESRERVYSVCNGVKRLISDEAINTEFDMEINVHCTDLQQLKLQENPYRGS